MLILKELGEVVNVEHRGQLYLIGAIIELNCGNKENAENMLQESANCSPEVCKLFVDGEDVEILPLHTGNEFASRFSKIVFPSFPKVKVRPAVTLPKIQPPLQLEDILTVVKKFFTFKTIAPRPEAPWLNRNKGTIQFTDLVLDFEVEESRKTIKKPVATRQSKSQYIRKNTESFINFKVTSKEKMQANGLLDKIKKICA